MLIESGINRDFGSIAPGSFNIPAHWKMDPPRIPALNTPAAANVAGAMPPLHPNGKCSHQHQRNQVFETNQKIVKHIFRRHSMIEFWRVCV